MRTFTYFSSVFLLAFLSLTGISHAQTTVLVPGSGNNSVACGTNVTLLDPGGTNNYTNNQEGYTVLNAAASAVVTITGSYDTENCCDHIYIYDGAGTGGPLLNQYQGVGTVNFTGNPGQTITVRFSSDISITNPGFSFSVSYSGACSSVPCAGTPNAGNAAASDTLVCSTVDLSLSGNTLEAGLTYQWQDSTANGVWANIPGATTINYTDTVTDTTWYRCIVTCTNSSQSDTSTISAKVVVQSFLACFCQPTFSFSCFSDYISNVTFATINNSTGCNNFQLYQNPNPVVFKGSTQSISITTQQQPFDESVGVWIDYDHSGSFSTSEFVFFGPVLPAPYTHTGTVTIPVTAVSGTTLMRVVQQYFTDVQAGDACGSFSFGEVEDYYITIQPLPYNEAGTKSIVTPSSPAANCTIDTTISMEISTIGQSPLTSADVYYQINSGTPQLTSWTGNLQSGQSDTVQLSTYNFANGDTLTVWTANPNGVQDSATFNDTIQIVLFDAMGGVYTIGGTTPDFPDVSSALSALYMRGVCDTVFFDMRPGTYNSQDTLQPYTGASATTPAIFRSENGIADSVRIQYDNSNFSANAVLTFDGGDWFGFENVTIQNVSTGSYRQVIFFNGNSANNWFMNCKIIGDTNTTSTSSNLILVYSPSGTSSDDSTRFINNSFWGGSDAIFLWGAPPSDKESGLVFKGNTINNPVRIGIAALYQNNVDISNNTILAYESTNTNMFLLDIEEAGGEIVVRNNFIANATGGFGINLVNVDGLLNNRALIANNYVFRGDTTGVGTFAEGIALQGCLFVDVINNTVNVVSANAQAACLNMDINTNTSAAIRVLNNNFKQSGTGYVLKVTSQYNIGMTDYNNLFTDSGKVAYESGTDYSTLADIQTAFGWGANSVSVNPNFYNDYHTCRPELDNVAMPLPLINNDLDGDQRYLTSPDIGADEFITPQKFSLGPDINKCVNDTVVLGSEIIQSATYNWSTFDTTATLLVSTVPPNLYFAVATTNCGIATDSIYVFNLPVAVAAFDTSNSFYTFSFTNNSQNSISYFWDFGDGDTSNLINPVHVYGAEGSYTVTLIATDSCGNSDTATLTIKVDIPGVAVKENLLADYSIYPNPSNGFFNIESAITEGGQAFVRITDINGRLVYRTGFIHPGGVYTKPIHLGDVRSGVYIVSIRVNDAIGMQKLIIK